MRGAHGRSARSVLRRLRGGASQRPCRAWPCGRAKRQQAKRHCHAYLHHRSRMHAVEAPRRRLNHLKGVGSARRLRPKFSPNHLKIGRTRPRLGQTSPTLVGHGPKRVEHTQNVIEAAEQDVRKRPILCQTQPNLWTNWPQIWSQWSNTGQIPATFGRKHTHIWSKWSKSA